MRRCPSLLCVAVIEYLILDNMLRKEIYLAQDSGGLKQHGTGV